MRDKFKKLDEKIKQKGNKIPKDKNLTIGSEKWYNEFKNKKG